MAAAVWPRVRPIARAVAVNVGDADGDRFFAGAPLDGFRFKPRPLGGAAVAEDFVRCLPAAGRFVARFTVELFLAIRFLWRRTAQDRCQRGAERRLRVRRSRRLSLPASSSTDQCPHMV